MSQSAGCPNCESTRHARCCAYCGKVHGPRRRHLDHCSVKCENDAARADQISDAMERDVEGSTRG